MSKDPETRAHQEWIGYVQPVGLVVSIPALMAAQAHVNRNIAPLHQRFLGSLPQDERGEPVPEIGDLATFTRDILEWEAEDLVPWSVDAPRHASLEVALPEYNERLCPTHVVPEFEPEDPERPWMMLVQQLTPGTPLDETVEQDERHWQASPHAKFERLLRETEIPIGLLCNGDNLRLVYAPRGESSGHMTFNVREMATVAGRPMFAGLHMLLSAERLFSLPEKQRLPALLADSRKYQSLVSTKLAEQVLGALYELLRGFQAADDQRHGELLHAVLAEDPDHVYAGLLTVLMRLVFILYAEDRDLLSSDAVYVNHYSVTGLFERLRADAGRYPDTMDQRYGAWAQLLTLFRIIYDGGRHGEFRIPARQGYLFDPDRYNFLEGRSWKMPRGVADTAEIPRVSDGVIFRVLQNLLILDGERLSYRTLDVEQIGSVYEAVMGFNLQVSQGRSIAIKAPKTHGAPTTINLEALLDCKPGQRAKWLHDHAEQKIAGQAAKALKSAESIEDLLVALERKIARRVTPNVVPKGAMVLQPSDERRRSGSHYTPRSLTEPIVRKALEPVLRKLSVDGSQLSDSSDTAPSSLTTDNRELATPTPNQILGLKICDPAMGSGAFLVEACRQLGDQLVRAWHVHGGLPKLPPDEDELLHARRLVAQRCIYGVDKNPMAVDLAKLSLWLATLAKDHPFTFLDHSLRCGDSLVGLTQEQIAGFHWDPSKKRSQGDVWFGDPIAERITRVTEYRQRILAARDDMPYEQLRQQLDLADESLSLARLTGDLVIAAFFSANKNKQRVDRLDTLARQLVKYMGPNRKMEDRAPLAQAVNELRKGEFPLQPFHWEIEFPEVFLEGDGGFDAFVGNPPFAGKNTMAGSNRPGYPDWLKQVHVESHGNADLVAHFFRRTFDLLRRNGTLGLIATNTIGQGDTRSTGLRWICVNGGDIYHAQRRVKWPGLAAVVVSVIHIHKGSYDGTHVLDGKPVETITAFLFHRGGHDDPVKLQANRGKSFQGSTLLGMGFTFDDTDKGGVATPLDEMHRLVEQNPRNADRIFPYIGGEEINSSPTHAHHRYVIDFGEMSEQEARTGWPDLMQVVEAKVKPERMAQKDKGAKDRWWQFTRPRSELRAAIVDSDRVLVCPQTSSVQAFAFIHSCQVFAHTLIVIPITSYGMFACLQTRAHQLWSAFLGPTMKDDLRYTPSDCFETYPFPSGVLELEPAGSADADPKREDQQFATLTEVGRQYYEYRADLMVRNNEGLTKTYNRFHDPDEQSPDIFKLRELHDAMDRAVLDAYGWTDIQPTCEFLLDWEDEENEDEPAAKRSKKKKPWRYRWPDDVRDEVLARLLELNKTRAEEERLAGLTAHAAEKEKTNRPGRRGAKKHNQGQRTMF